MSSHQHSLTLITDGHVKLYRSKAFPQPPLKSDYKPRKSWLIFFVILSVIVFSYLVFNSTYLRSGDNYFRVKTQSDEDLGYTTSFSNTVSYVRNKIVNAEKVLFNSQEPGVQKKRYTNVWKRILIYTKLFGAAEWSHMHKAGLRNIMSRCKCKIRKCRVTYDNELLGRSDAVIFHAADMPSPESLRNLRKMPGSSKQRWLYFSAESAENVPDTTPFDNLFNLTMTVKVESDIWLPYGRFEPLNKGDKRPFIRKNYAKGKKSGAAWVVSHCGRIRDQYVLKLQEDYPVFVGGNCGPMYKYQMSCKKSCDDDIKTNFKYYLAFENGFCRNYITEKYWDRAIKNEAIPIVMGAGPYDFGRYGAVPGSFIKVEDFATTTDLALYLQYLDKNDTAYNEYFLWKQRYKIYKAPMGDWPHPCTFLCELCDILHDIDYPNKVYHKLSKFLDVDKNCGGRDSKVRGIIDHSRDFDDFTART